MALPNSLVYWNAFHFRFDVYSMQIKSDFLDDKKYFVYIRKALRSFSPTERKPSVSIYHSFYQSDSAVSNSATINSKRKYNEKIVPVCLFTDRKKEQIYLLEICAKFCLADALRISLLRWVNSLHIETHRDYSVKLSMNKHV